ncbi:MAG TPA: alpha/beta hydrolase [Acidimicrobiales bacterium]|nr:alpha/beta hydrolase [Acidimicrobiales bacterium]
MLRLASTDGVELAVHHLGGDGPPLLMAHATGFCGSVLAPLAAHLTSSFSCWTFDARGHGDTVTPPGIDWDWAGFAADVLVVVAGLGLERPLAFGHSSGGAAVLDAEARRPGTFAALWCYEPIVWPEVGEALTASREPLIAGALKRRDHFSSRDEAYENFAAKPPLASLDAEALRAYVDCGFEPVEGGVRLRCRPAVEAEIYREGLRHDGFGRLGLVGCPVTIGRGDRSLAVEREVAEAQVGALASAALATFAELGHFGPLEDPRRVGRAVAAAFGAG